MEIDKEEFKKKYPKLIDEMEYSDNKIKIDSGKKKADSPKNDKGKKGFEDMSLQLLILLNDVQPQKKQIQ